MMDFVPLWDIEHFERYVGMKGVTCFVWDEVDEIDMICGVAKCQDISTV